MQRFIVLFVFAIVCSMSAGAASPNDEATAQVTKFVDNFNKGDVKAARATHTHHRTHVDVADIALEAKVRARP